jgi:cell wall-associated NlpC family hydrolase
MQEEDTERPQVVNGNIDSDVDEPQEVQESPLKRQRVEEEADRREQEAEEAAMREKEARAEDERQERLKKEAEKASRQEAARRAKAEAKAKAEAEAKAKAEAGATAKAEALAEAKAKEEAEAKAKAKADAEAKAKAEVVAKAKAEEEAEAKAKAEAEAQASEDPVVQAAEDAESKFGRWQIQTDGGWEDCSELGQEYLNKAALAGSPGLTYRTDDDTRYDIEFSKMVRRQWNKGQDKAKEQPAKEQLIRWILPSNREEDNLWQFKSDRDWETFGPAYQIVLHVASLARQKVQLKVRANRYEIDFSTQAPVQMQRNVKTGVEREIRLVPRTVEQVQEERQRREQEARERREQEARRSEQLELAEK